MNSLIVALNGIQVGQLQQETSGALAFQYSENWLNRPGVRAISLSLPLSTQHYRGTLVYNFFDNLLPDSDAIRGRMQARFKIPTSHPFDLLSRIGRDCVGAIQLYPSNSSVPPVNTVKAEPLHESDIETILKNHQNSPLGKQKRSLCISIPCFQATSRTTLVSLFLRGFANRQRS